MTYVPFKYKVSRKKPPISSSKPEFADTPERLTGSIKGMPAAKGEERFANALRGYEFRFRINPTGIPRGMPGWLELDFLINTPFGYRAIEIDDMEFVHRGVRKSAEMVLKDNRRKKGLAGMGIDVREIEHIDTALLETQEDANTVVRNLLT